jgi:hypothetical protein
VFFVGLQCSLGSSVASPERRWPDHQNVIAQLGKFLRGSVPTPGELVVEAPKGTLREGNLGKLFSGSLAWTDQSVTWRVPVSPEIDRDGSGPLCRIRRNPRERFHQTFFKEGFIPVFAINDKCLVIMALEKQGASLSRVANRLVALD